MLFIVLDFPRKYIIYCAGLSIFLGVPGIVDASTHTVLDLKRGSSIISVMVSAIRHGIFFTHKLFLDFVQSLYDCFS